MDFPDDDDCDDEIVNEEMSDLDLAVAITVDCHDFDAFDQRSPELERILQNFYQGTMSAYDLCVLQEYKGDCIDYLNDYIPNKSVGQTPNTNYYQAFLKRLDEPVFLDMIKKYLSGKKVIELGPGNNPIAKELFEKVGISEYVGLEPFFPKLAIDKINGLGAARILEEDGLSFLENQRDGSLIVVSFGVIAPELCGFRNNDYYRFLCKEIYRVTPEKSISIHGMKPGRQDYEKLLTTAGFLSGDAQGFNHIWLKE